jgi:hypothetical protein
VDRLTAAGHAVAEDTLRPMPSTPVAPWRTGRRGRPDVPLPPDRMPLVRGGRPLKRWRWIGAFGEDVMLCAAAARVGPVPVWWWAVWDRRSRTLAEHLVRRAGPVRVDGDRVVIDDGPVAADLRVEQTAGVETVSPHGAQYAWTRKQGGVRVTGTVTVLERHHDVDAAGVVDDSAGYHARRTSWRWSAGVGTATDGTPVAWNLVAGLHDGLSASERTVWVGGEPHEAGPARFAADLGAVETDGCRLAFTPEARRGHREALLLVSSDYEQPFGTFAGTLPHAGALHGFGVMERHDARW